MTLLNRFRRDLLAALLLAVLPLAIYWSVTVGDRTMVPADNLFQWEPWASEAASFDVEVPQNGLLSDLVIESYVWKQFITESLQNGEIPLWNPNLFAGTPFLATGQHSAYYPFSIIFLLLPLAKAFGWYTLIQVWLAGVAMYAFGRMLRLSRGAALFAGIVYQGSGFLIVSAAVFPMIAGAAVWMPLVLASIEKVVRCGVGEKQGRTLPWAVLGATALGMQVLAGHIEITYYTLLVAAFYAAWRYISLLLQRKRDGLTINRADYMLPVAWVSSILLIGMMLGGIQFVPFLEVGRANFREGSASLEQIRGWAFPPRRLITLLMPDFFGNPADHGFFDLFALRWQEFKLNYFGKLNPHGASSSAWGMKNYVEGGIYLGILPLLLAGLALWKAVTGKGISGRPYYFFAALGFVSLAFVFGTPLYSILYYGFPGINQLHSPFRWVFPLSLSVAALAGLGFEHLGAPLVDGVAQSVSAWRRRRRNIGSGSVATLWAPATATTVVGSAAIWASVITVAGLVALWRFFPQFEPHIERLFLGLTRATDAFDSTKTFFSYEFEQLFKFVFFLFSAGVVLRLSRSAVTIRGRMIWKPLALIVLLADLVVAGYGFNVSTRPELLEYRPEVVTWLRSETAAADGPWRATTFAPHGDKPLNANTLWLVGVQDVRGYDSVILKPYTKYMSAIEPQRELEFNRIQPIVDPLALESPLLDLLGVKYVVTTESISSSGYELAWNSEALSVYRNVDVMPRGYSMPLSSTVFAEDPLESMSQFDPRQHVILDAAEAVGLQLPVGAISSEPIAAEIVSYSNNEVILRGDVADPQWMVLNDSYAGGWKAYARPINDETIREKELKIVRVNGNFRGVLLDPDELGIEPGIWEVRFRYSPLSFFMGGLTSFMGATIILFAAILWLWRRYYRESGPVTGALSVAKNSLAPMGLNLFNRAIDFAFAAFYLRLLGPTDSGKYFTAIIIASWFEIVSNFGLNTLVIREVSADRGQASHYLLNTTILRAGTSLVAAIPIAIYLGGIEIAGRPLGGDTMSAMLLIIVGMLLSNVGQGVSGLFYAFEIAEVPAALTTVTTILKVVLGAIVLVAGFGFVGLAAVSIGTNLITLIILAAATLRYIPLKPPWKVDFGLQKEMVGRSYPLMFNHFLAVVFFQVDVPLLRQYNGEEVVGWYNSAYKWVNAFNVIPAFFTFALFPVITRMVKTSLKDARRAFRMAVKLMLIIALPLAAVTTVMAPFLIGVLGGREFLPHGALALQLVVWSIPLGWVNSVTNYVLIALRQEKRLTLAFIAGVTFNIVANIILLPRFSYVAAAVTTIISELVLLIAFGFFLRTGMKGIGWPRLVTRPLILTALMMGAILAGKLVSTPVAVMAGSLVYLAGLWKIGVFEPEERRILRSILPERVVAALRLRGAIK